MRRYVSYASESCIQELLAASDSGRGGADGDGDDGWKVLVYHNGVEISKRRTGPAHVFRSRWLLQDVSPEQFMAVANAVDAAKVPYHPAYILITLRFLFSFPFQVARSNFLLTLGQKADKVIINTTEGFRKSKTLGSIHICCHGPCLWLWLIKS